MAQSRGVRTLLLAAAYFASARLGLSLAFEAEQVTAVWPPSGIALAAVLLLGARLWPGIALGAFLANLMANEPAPVALGIAFGNTLEALIGGWMINRFAGRQNPLGRLRGVFGLIAFAGGLGTAVAATVGVTSLCLGGVQPWDQYWSLWTLWWLGDAAGVVVVAPVLLAWLTRARWIRGGGGVAEGLALLIGLSMACLFVFLGPWAHRPPLHPLVYTVFPFVTWAALRFDPRVTSAVTIAVSASAIAGTLRGAGPFATADIDESLRLLQLFMAVVAATGLLLSAAVTERNVADVRRWVDQSISETLSNAAELGRVMPQILRTVCDRLGWDIGEIWILDEQTMELRCSDIWHDPTLVASEFITASRDRTFQPGVGLPGRVWSTGLPAWISDLAADPNFPRSRAAAAAGLRTGFAFPLLADGRLLGAMEFFSRDPREPDRELVGFFAGVGARIGLFIARRQAQEAYQRSQALRAAVLDSAIDCFVTFNARGWIIESNAATERTLGYSRTEMLGRRIDEILIPSGLHPDQRGALAGYLRTGSGTMIGERLEMAALRADGTRIPIEVSITAFDLHGDKTFTACIHDITERKRAEEALREADLRKDEFLATLAHELRNPLAPIRNAMEIIRMAADPDVIARAREVMGRQVDRMVHLIDDLLDLSRISRGKIELRVERVDLRTIVQDALETSRPILDRSGHALNVSLPTEPIPVDADPARLSQVICNLVNNACKYTENGGAIWIAAERSNGDVVVRVRDTGIGIPPEMLDRIFDMFAQVDRSLERSQGGLGIGLSLVKRLVELHGGTVRAASSGPGQGSEFVVRLQEHREPGQESPVG